MFSIRREQMTNINAVIDSWEIQVKNPYLTLEDIKLLKANISAEIRTVFDECICGLDVKREDIQFILETLFKPKARLVGEK